MNLIIFKERFISPQNFLKPNRNLKAFYLEPKGKMKSWKICFHWRRRLCTLSPSESTMLFFSGQLSFWSNPLWVLYKSFKDPIFINLYTEITIFFTHFLLNSSLVKETCTCQHFQEDELADEQQNTNEEWVPFSR